jgi:hypothetical protein
MARRATVLFLLLGSLAFASSAHALSGGRVCGYIRASVPYSRHGNAEGWRVYVAGVTTCRVGEQALSAVMHLRAARHVGRDEAHTYSVFGNWRCPAGHMGFQYCNIPASAPFRARALAVECAENGCPSRRPPIYLFS